MARPKDNEIRKEILREIGKHPGIKISKIVKYTGISFQVVNKILKESWMSNFVKSTVNKKEKSNIPSFLTFETKDGEDEKSIISKYEDILDAIRDDEQEQKEKKMDQEEIMHEYEQEQKQIKEEIKKKRRAEKVQKSNNARI